MSVDIVEGQIYEGTISLSGNSNDIKRRWIVVAPFGKTHIHSIDNPLELHCWPISLVHEGLNTGKLKLVDFDTNHPILHLQRDKEACEIHDAHLGLFGESLEKMLYLLQEAAENGKAYTPYAAAEILEFMDRSLLSMDSRKEYQARINDIIKNRSNLLGSAV